MKLTVRPRRRERMLKLYKRGRPGVRYWEAWKVSGMVVVHEGKLGDRGKTKSLIPKDGQTPARCIREAAAKPRSKGLAENPLDEQHQLLVQYRLPPWGSPAHP